MYTKDLHEAKYQYLINKREDISTDHFDDPKAFIEYSNNMNVYKNIDGYNPDKENKIWIVFDNMIADMIHNKKTKFSSYWIVTESLLFLLPNQTLKFQKMLH